jgi:hypothetical protein
VGGSVSAPIPSTNMRRPGVHIELSKVTIPLLVSQAASRRSKWRMTFPGTEKIMGRASTCLA